MKLSKTLLTLLLFDLFLFAIYFGLKIYLEPVAIVVPHHNIVAQKRLEYFQQIAKKNMNHMKQN